MFYSIVTFTQTTPEIANAVYANLAVMEAQEKHCLGTTITTMETNCVRQRTWATLAHAEEWVAFASSLPNFISGSTVTD